MKYYLIAGEASGDLHGSRLMQAIRQRDPGAEFRIWGGDLMEAAGGQLVKHYRDLAFMGFVEVVANLRTILRNLHFCKEDITQWQPDKLILIDYPGFNLRIAKWAVQIPAEVIYYISPQIWAWHTSRVHQIKRTVDRMLVILPFEQEFYAKHGMAVDFVGHPLLDVVEHFEPTSDFRQRYALDDRPIVALLPGSRRQEIERVLPIMLETASRFPDLQFAIAGAPSRPPDQYELLMEQSPKVATIRLISNETYALLHHAHAALVTSGTATLETAMFNVPLCVCYRGGGLSYWIARRLVEVKYISLVNLIVDRPLVQELIQQELTADNLAEELSKLLDPIYRERLQAGFAELRQLLGQSGAASKAAELITQSAI